MCDRTRKVNCHFGRHPRFFGARTMLTHFDIGLYVTTLVGNTPYTREKTTVYLIWSNYQGQTYVEHINSWPQNISKQELLSLIFKELNCEGTPSDYLANCLRFGHKIKFDGEVFDVNSIPGIKNDSCIQIVDAKE